MFYLRNKCSKLIFLPKPNLQWKLPPPPYLLFWMRFMEELGWWCGIWYDILGRMLNTRCSSHHLTKQTCQDNRNARLLWSSLGSLVCVVCIWQNVDKSEEAIIYCYWQVKSFYKLFVSIIKSIELRSPVRGNWCHKGQIKL